MEDALRSVRYMREVSGGITGMSKVSVKYEGYVRECQVIAGVSQHYPWHRLTLDRLFN